MSQPIETASIYCKAALPSLAFYETIWGSFLRHNDMNPDIA